MVRISHVNKILAVNFDCVGICVCFLPLSPDGYGVQAKQSAGKT
jgi:hypothetical protein